MSCIKNFRAVPYGTIQLHDIRTVRYVRTIYVRIKTTYVGTRHPYAQNGGTAGSTSAALIEDGIPTATMRVLHPYYRGERVLYVISSSTA